MSLSQSSEINLTDNGKLALNAKSLANSAQSAAERAQELAGGAQRTADGKNSVYRGTNPNLVPTANLQAGDLYFTDNALYTWNGSSWDKTVSDTTGAEIGARVDDALAKAKSAEETADGKNKVYRVKDISMVTATDLKVGDLCFTDNALYTWNGSSWDKTVSDTTGAEIGARVDDALAKAKSAEETADSKNKIYRVSDVSTIATANLKTGDLCFTDNAVYTWNGSSWDKVVSDTTGAEISAKVADALAKAKSAEETADSKNKVYRVSDVSTIATAGLKTGDICFTDTAVYTWTGTAWEKTVSDTTGAEISAKVDAAMQESQKSVADLKADTEAKVTQLDASLTTTTNDLSTTKADLADTKNNLATTTNDLKNNLSTVSNDLSATKTSLATTANDLSNVKTDLADTKSSLSTTVADLQKQTGQLSGSIDTANSKIEYNSNAIAEVKHTAEEISTTVSNIRVGGRNLLTNTRTLSDVWSGTTETVDGFTVVKATQINDGIYNPIAWNGLTNIKSNTDYVLTFYAKASKQTLIYSYLYNIGTDTVYGDGSTPNTLTTDFQRYVVHFHTMAMPADRWVNCLPVRLTENGVTVWIYGVQLEEGNTATQWQPNPADTDQAISKISQTADAIRADLTNTNGDVASVKATASAISTDLTNAKGDIASVKATADSLTTSMANANNQISTLQQRADSITSTLSNGGVNLLTGTSDFSWNIIGWNFNPPHILIDDDEGLKDYKISLTTGASNQGFWWSGNNTVGQTYTLSFDARCDNVKAKIPMMGLEGNFLTDAPLTTEWVRYHVSGKVTSGGYNWVTYFSTTEEDNVYVRKYQIEYGDTATPWKPSNGDISSLQQTAQGLTADMQDAKGNISSLQQTAQGLTADMQDAKGNISSLQAKADSLTSSMANANNQISTLQQRADSITSTLSNGGVNLLSGTSDFSWPLAWWAGSGSSSINQSDTYNDSEKVTEHKCVMKPEEWQGIWWGGNNTVGQTYTLSFDARCDNGKAKIYMMGLEGNFLTDAPLTTEWVRYHVSGKVTSGGHNWVTYFSTTESDNVYTRKYQIEYGDTATPWKPSNGDISSLQQTASKLQSDLTNAQGEISSVTQTANSLNAYVKGSNGSNTLASILSMDPNNSTIGQVVNGHVVAAINTSSDGSVKIDGKALHISANTTIDQAVIHAANIDSVNASTITAGTLDASVVNVKNINANNISAGTLAAEHLHVTKDTTIDNAIIKSAMIDSISANQITAGTIDASKINVTNLNANNISAGILAAEHLHVTKDTTIDNAIIKSAMIDSLSADKLTAGTIDANKINVLNINADNISAGTLAAEHLHVTKDTTIDNAIIGDAQIKDLSASKLTAGTIDASQIRVINLDANNITTGTLSARINDLRKFKPYVVSPSNTWNFDDTKSTYDNWFLIGETNTNHVWNGPPGITPYMYVTSRGTQDANGSDRYVVTVWKDNDPTQYQRVWNGSSWSEWVMLPNSQNIVSAINLSPDSVKISGKNIELSGNTRIADGFTLSADKISAGTLNGVTFVSEEKNKQLNGNGWNDYKVTMDDDGVTITGNYNNNGAQTNSTAYVFGDRFYQELESNGWSRVIDINVSGDEPSIRLTNSVNNNGTSTYISPNNVYSKVFNTDNFQITDHQIRSRDNKYLLVANSNGTNFDNFGSVIFQVWGGVTLGQNTIAVPSNDMYFQQGNADDILAKTYIQAGRVTLHADHIASQSANTVTSRLSAKTDIIPVSYDRALAAVEGTEMYDYRYISDDSGQHYVSGIIDDVNPEPQYHMDNMLINKERTARIDSNLVGYHQVVIQKLLERVATLEAKLNNK